MSIASFLLILYNKTQDAITLSQLLKIIASQERILHFEGE
ncbi:MAG: hypothetical protein BSOLF_0464 [Candidatus Carbobacillus altaicus]|uniref:Uncharacterized protein n=1 Tax=Candidatus Carbonibacillus altaicus TaxID=2163959 RepID=A0A2R6Y5K9_9BACL|nr:MAG: hypothetical protein BSOLF_0464 [Candidatus Carbobacillus altaicus]